MAKSPAPSPSPGRAPDRPKPKGRLGHTRIMRAASDDDTMLDAERKASPFCTGRAIVVNENEPEESAGPARYESRGKSLG